MQCLEKESFLSEYQDSKTVFLLDPIPKIAHTASQGQSDTIFFVDIKKKIASYRHAQKMNALNLHKRNLKLFSGPTLTPKQLNIAQTGTTNLKLKLTLDSKFKLDQY